ncbi:MAG: DoxX family protein [Chloroflexota bacterium]|nr:DoxX family protein [Chloroflexota bacterium]
MISLIVLVVSLIILRGAGWLGVRHFSTWRDAGRYALAVMFMFTGVSHFTSMKHDFAAMIPSPLPNDLWVIYLTGVFEMAGAIGLLIPRTRRLAGICLGLLLLAMFPANVYAALEDIPLSGRPPTTLWLRTPMQLLYIGIVWWTAVSVRPRQLQRTANPDLIQTTRIGVR